MTEKEKPIHVSENKNKRPLTFPIELCDDNDNKIIVEASKAHNSNNRVIFIKLASENHRRKIGHLNTEKRWLVVLRKKRRHLHRLSKSYGFNYSIISEAKQFDKILLRDDNSSYEIPNEVILKEGKFLFFKEQGFEVQIFLTLKRIKDFERGHII